MKYMHAFLTVILISLKYFIVSGVSYETEADKAIRFLPFLLYYITTGNKYV